MQPPPQTISVALCTYNGERFLPAQLNSILRQSRLPDQLVICDDRSSDNTLSLLTAFQTAAPFPVIVHRNKQNLGSIRNFEQAIQLCSGNLIALSDQDDLWHPDRLKRSEQELNTHPQAGLVFTNGEVIDDNGRKIGIRLWENFELEGLRQESLRAENYIPMTRKRFITGATIMFRATYVPWCFPIGDRWVHDGWIAAIIGAMSSIRMVDEPLLLYRQHSSQQIGLGPGRGASAEKMTLDLMARQHWSSLPRFRDDAAQVCQTIATLPISPHQKGQGVAHAFQLQHDFLSMRLALPQNRLARIPIMAGQLPQYFTCAMGLLSIAKDLILPKPPGIEHSLPSS